MSVSEPLQVSECKVWLGTDPKGQNEDAALVASANSPSGQISYSEVPAL